MQSLLKISFLLFPLFLKAQPNNNNIKDGEVKYYFDNGKISSQGTMRQGKPDGYWKTYNEYGFIKSEGNRKNFQLDSTWKFYNEQGKLSFEYNYKAGKKNGLRKTYDSKDHYLVSAENFVDDVKQNSTLNYYKNGKMKQQIPFVNGKEEGQGYELSTDSTIITITQYKMGFIQHEERINRRNADSLKTGIWKVFYPSGTLKNEVNYSDDKMNGYFKEYNVTGSLINTTKYINGVLQTKVPELAKVDVKTDYYEGGFVKSTGTYKDGVAVGIHREFNKEGKVIGAKMYADGAMTGEGILDTIGRMQGQWIEYHSNGEIKSKGEYINSKRVGDWIFYYPNEKIEQQGTYDRKGKAQGKWKWFYDTGNIWKEELYRNNLQDGLLTEYNDSGKVITKGEFVDGQKEGEWMLELPDYKEVGNFKADFRDGEWKHYFTSTGNLRYVGKFIDGVPDGVQKFYYPNGKEKQIGEYRGGNKEGDWHFYDETGFVFLTIYFKNDVEISFDGVKVVPETPLSEPSIK